MEKIGRFVWGKIFVLFFRPLYWLENRAFLWPLVNRKARAHFKKHRLPLEGVEARIVDELKKNGIAVTSLNKLFGNGDELLKELTAYAHFDTGGIMHPVKSFVINFFDVVPKISMDNPFARLALNERILNIAGHYLGMSPKLQEFALAEIKEVPTGTEKVGSMRWHRDPNDRRLMKMFIYLSDVGPENGPFTYLTKSNAENKYAHVFPQVPPAGIYPPYGEVEKKVDGTDVFAAQGKAGTVVFADTAGLHGGGYVLKGYRRMSTFGYLPPKSFLVRMIKTEPKTINSLSLSLAPLPKYALSGSEFLFSRELYKTLKGLLEGRKSLGVHITGRM